MIEIVICLIIWCWNLTPLWLNILLTILLFVRFSWRLLLTITKIFKLNDNCYVVDDLTDKAQSSIRKCKDFIKEVLK